MLRENQLRTIKERCAKNGAILVAVTKTRSLDELQALIKVGHTIFGENRVQDLLEKKEQLPNTIEWHLIGHLQRNKVKYIADFIGMIHSVDSIKLLKEINKEGKKNNRIIACLLQFHIAEEESKFGIQPEKVEDFMSKIEQLDLSNVVLKGVMGMASFTDDKEQVRNEFRQLKKIYNLLKSKYFSSVDYFDTTSMGMSGDYTIALEEGSTMLRVGSKLFEA